MSQYAVYLLDGSCAIIKASKVFYSDDGVLIFLGEKKEPLSGFVKGYWTHFEKIKDNVNEDVT